MTCTVLQQKKTVLWLQLRSSYQKWLPRSNVMEQCVQLVAVPSKTGSVVLITCTVLLQKKTVLWLQLRPSYQKWLPRSNVMEQCVQLAAVPSKTGSVVQTTNTALLPLLTVPLLRSSSSENINYLSNNE